MASAPLVQPPFERTLSVVPARPTGGPSPTVLAAFECSLSTGTLDRLERIAEALSDPWLRRGYDGIAGTHEVALLATCCRRELFVVGRDGEVASRWRSTLPGPAQIWRARHGREAVRHLYRVAAGCESLVFGEREVRSQVRAAARRTLSRHRRRVLRDLFNGAASEADRTAPVVVPARSIAAVAAERLLDACSSDRPRVVVVGSGAVGRQVVERLGRRAQVCVVYRDRPPDEAFLRAHGARAVRTDALRDEVAFADAVVTAVKSGGRCLGPEDLSGDRARVVLDLGVPRNVDPRVRAMAGHRLLDLEDLREATRPVDALAFEATLAAAADDAYGGFERLAVEPWVAEARRRAEATRAAELSMARPYLGSLSPQQEAAVDRLTRRLVERLLRAPTERVRRIPPGPDGDRLRRFAVELLDPDGTGANG